MTLSGRFVTLEGGEGVGKSTLMARLVAALSRPGLDIVATREPGGTPLAEKVRALALTPQDGAPLSGLAQALLMNAARADHLDRLIRPALARGALVLCDRFADSTRVYQAVTGGCSEALLLRLERDVVGETRPDLTLILDAPPAELLGRRAGRGAGDIYEHADLSVHEAIRARFRAIAEAEPERCVLVDALAGPEAVEAAALNAIRGRLGGPS